MMLKMLLWYSTFFLWLWGLIILFLLVMINPIRATNLSMRKKVDFTHHYLKLFKIVQEEWLRMVKWQSNWFVVNNGQNLISFQVFLEQRISQLIIFLNNSTGWSFLITEEKSMIATSRPNILEDLRREKVSS
jgi:hypothetical protein